MLRHIVMWKFAPAPRRSGVLFLTGLQGLYGAIPELKSCQVLRGMEGSDYDAVLISGIRRIRRRWKLSANDPRHKAVSALCKVHPDGPGGAWTVCCRIRRNKQKTSAGFLRGSLNMAGGYTAENREGYGNGLYKASVGMIA